MKIRFVYKGKHHGLAAHAGQRRNFFAVQRKQRGSVQRRIAHGANTRGKNSGNKAQSFKVVRPDLFAQRTSQAHCRNIAGRNIRRAQQRIQRQRKGGLDLQQGLHISGGKPQAMRQAQARA